MKLSYKYRLYPNKTQAQRLGYLLSLGRAVYNDALAHRIWKWERSRQSISLYDLRDYYCDLRHEDPDGLGLLPAKTVDALIRRLDKSYKAFFKRFREGHGFPKFKNRKTFRSLDYVYGNGVSFREYHFPGDSPKLRITNVGEIRIRYHRALPAGTKIKNIVVSEDGQGNWWASFQCEVESRPLPMNMTEGHIGIDVGLKYVLALSDGQTLDMPGYLKENLRKLRVLQRKLDRQRRAMKRMRRGY